MFDLNGNEIHISDLWKDRKVVVAFVAILVFCCKRVDYLASKKFNYYKLIIPNLKTHPTLEVYCVPWQNVMDKAGVALVLIEPGSIDQASARTMCESENIEDSHWIGKKGVSRGNCGIRWDEKCLAKDLSREKSSFSCVLV
ncbi:hypothetical protein GQ457_13G013880 [Hibiscus cannabinus]